MTEADAFARIVAPDDLGLPEAIRTRLAAYARALLARNATTNLTAARTPAAVAEHIRDSIALATHVRDPLIDIGSGGGFPAIPLAIVTGVRVALVESIAKKAAFLREVADELDLPIDVLCARAEDVGRDPAHRGRYAAATARAVAGVTTVLELVVPLLSIGGFALLQRGSFGPNERIATSDALLVLGATLEDEIAMVPNPSGHSDEADARRLLVVRKLVATGPRFPRRAGIPAKRPLCVEEAARA